MKKIATLRVAEVTGRIGELAIHHPLAKVHQTAKLVDRTSASGDDWTLISQTMKMMTRAAKAKILLLRTLKYNQALALVQLDCRQPKWSKQLLKLPKQHRRAQVRCQRTR